MKPVIIIPAYQPECSLLTLIERLNPMQQIIIVDDGSGKEYHELFNQLKVLKNVTLLQHAVNLGKGQALKTAFNYFLNAYPGCKGVITADADGQHLPEDIFKVSASLSENPHQLILGVRLFKKGVPWKSRLGNNLTKMVFRLFIGQSLQDTQTGLRGIPRDFLKDLLKTTSLGYDFELDMLICACKQKMKIREIPIQTVYKNNNQGSHFNPLIDSFKIYFVFFRFLIFSIISGLLDFLAFSLAFLVFGQVFISETMARLFSGTCNFLFNKELVFKSKHRMLPEALKYTLLCLINLIFSYGLINTMVFLNFSVYISKLIALFSLFFANFAIQNLLVFGQEEEALIS